MVTIEIVYASSTRQKLMVIQVPENTTILKAIETSGILTLFPEIDLGVNKIGIFGTLTPPDEILNDRDRIEIYRPLLIDPKQARINRTKRAGNTPCKK